ncbi:hyaluronan and proteoglycan link protein 1 [Brachionichthys hirsutus]|uniref:hyaluronan and proteoglycan link protein 1 n=1 Tax=Brachionichthys hirsutus TaxID=412623 RepID=UPI0036053A34
MIPVLIGALIALTAADLNILYPNLQPSKIIYFSDSSSQLSVVAEPSKVWSRRGGNATLPCMIERDQSIPPNPKLRVKWTKLTSDFLIELKVYVVMDYLKRSYGDYQGRVHLRGSSPMDASLVITEVTLEDYGSYKCEVIDGLFDATAVVALDIEGVVFPYSPRLGRYNLNFHDAETACEDQDAVVASPEQLYDAWEDKMDWCNAGWLSDGTVQYPITNPREPCGGKNAAAGIRNYGQRDKETSHFDVFCFTSNYTGLFYYLIHPSKLTYDEAVGACQNNGSQIAKVGQMYAAWKLLGYDRCDPGWLADGSVRYPVSCPRPRCSPTGAAVRSHGFPDKKQRLYGVYCFKGPN